MLLKMSSVSQVSVPMIMPGFSELVSSCRLGTLFQIDWKLTFKILRLLFTM